MTLALKTPPETVRLVLDDYAAKDETGAYRYTLAEIAERRGVQPKQVSSLARRKGLGRYTTRGGS